MKNTTRLLSLLLVLFVSFGASAQKDKAAVQGGLSKAQLAQIDEWQKGLTTRIEQGFAAYPDLKASMSSELKVIGTMKDVKAKSVAATAYRKKYLKDYGIVLAKGSVNMDDEAQKLRQILPAYTVTVTDYQVFAHSEDILLPPVLLPPAPKTLKITEHENYKDLNCGGIAAGAVDFGDTYIQAYAAAAGLGGCINSGEKIAQIRLEPNTKSAVAVIKFNAETYGFAVGTLGAASCSAYAFASLNDERLFTLSDECFAPFLWISENEKFANKILNVPLPTTKTSKLLFRVSSNVVSGISPNSTCRSSFKVIDVTINSN